MVRGEYVPQTRQGAVPVPAAIPSQRSPDDPPKYEDQKPQPEKGVIVSKEAAVPFQNVSMNGENRETNSGMASRAPAPIVPASVLKEQAANASQEKSQDSDTQHQASASNEPAKESTREEAASRSNTPANDREDDTLTGNVFRSATLTKSVPQSDKAKDAKAGNSTRTTQENPDAGDDTAKEKTDSEGDHRESDGFVSVKVPDLIAQEQTQRSGIHSDSPSSESPYRAAGSTGSNVLNLDAPSYGPGPMTQVGHSGPAQSAYIVRFTP